MDRQGRRAAPTGRRSAASLPPVADALCPIFVEKTVWRGARREHARSGLRARSNAARAVLKFFDVFSGSDLARTVPGSVCVRHAVFGAPPNTFRPASLQTRSIGGRMQRKEPGEEWGARRTPRRSGRSRSPILAAGGSWNATLGKNAALACNYSGRDASPKRPGGDPLRRWTRRGQRGALSLPK